MRIMAPDVNAAASHTSDTTTGARVLKGLSLLTLGLVALSLVLVHGDSYEPAVSYVPLYLIFSVILATAIAMLLLPTSQFGDGFCAAQYVLYAALFAAAAFFTGGVSSELYALFFPLVIAPALHGSWKIGLMAQASALVAYALAMLPDVLDEVDGGDGAALVFYRLATLALVGIFALAVAGRGAGGGDGVRYAVDEDGTMLLQAVAGEIGSKRGGRLVSTVLFDPGSELDEEEMELLMERVGARIGEPFLLGRGTVFGIVLPGADERKAESAARRTIAAASTLGAADTRAGVATYPRDASSAGNLLAAAGQALESAYASDSRGAIAFASPAAPEPPSYRAAR